MDKRDCRLYHITISWISRRDNGAHILVFAPFAICIVLHTYKIYYKCTSTKCSCKFLRFATLCLFRQLFIYWLVISELISKIMDFCANRVFYQQNREINNNLPNVLDFLWQKKKSLCQVFLFKTNTILIRHYYFC